jgi:hypothetical protein
MTCSDCVDLVAFRVVEPMHNCEICPPLNNAYGASLDTIRGAHEPRFAFALL